MWLLIGNSGTIKVLEFLGDEYAGEDALVQQGELLILSDFQMLAMLNTVEARSGSRIFRQVNHTTGQETLVRVRDRLTQNLDEYRDNHLDLLKRCEEWDVDDGKIAREDYEALKIFAP